MDNLILKLVTLLATLAVVTQAKTSGTLSPLPPDPCAGVPIVDSVSQADEKASLVCLKPSQNDLQVQLERIGGIPKRFVGITPQDACNFTLPSSIGNFQNVQQFSATTTQPPLPQRDSGLAEDHPQPRSRRVKRSPVSEELSCIGKASMNSETGLFHMCDMCWYKTTLEENKFPREISELVCKTQSSSGSSSSSTGGGACLGQSFLGRCQQKVLKLQFLQWDGKTYEDQPESTPGRRVVKQKWVHYTQDIRSCCECEASQTLISG